MTNYIWFKTQKSAFHHWPDAPKEVKYLSVKHRHLFYFKIHIEVHHNDREIEFHMFRNPINEYIQHWEENLESSSCEMLADRLNNFIHKRWPNRKVIIEVSEDNECRTVMKYSNQ